MIKKALTIILPSIIFAGCTSTQPINKDYTPPSEARKLLMQNIDEGNKRVPIQLNKAFEVTKVSEGQYNSLEIVFETTVLEELPKGITPEKLITVEINELRRGICGGEMPGYKNLIDHNITISMAFKKKDGVSLGTASVDRDICKK